MGKNSTSIFLIYFAFHAILRVKFFFEKNSLKKKFSKHVTSDIIQTIWIVSPLTCKVIRRQIDIWIVSVVSILWILIPVSHLDSVSSVFLLDYGSHALALDCDPGLTLDSVYISIK